MGSLLDLGLRGAAAAWLVVGTAVAAYVLACRVQPGMRTTERAVAIAISGIWLATLGFHLLATFQLFTLPAALVGCGALAALALWRDPLALRKLGRELRAWRRLARAARRGPERLWVLGLAACALPVVLRPWLAPPLGWDALTYHAVKAALWVQGRGELQLRAPGPWSSHGSRWAGASVLTSWSMLPFESDLLATGAEVLAWALLGLALLALGRALGVREPVASAAAGFVLALPTVRLLIGAGYAEPFTCLCFAAGCLFAVRFARTGRVGFALLAFASLGLTLGMKLTFLRSSAVLLLVVAVSLMRRRAAGVAVWQRLLLCAMAFGLVLAPWAIRSTLETGLPFSPLPIKIFGVALGAAPPELIWYMDRPALRAAGLAGEARTLATLFLDFGRGREVPTVLALLPLLLVPLGVVYGGRARGTALLLLVPSMLADVFTYAGNDIAVVRLRYPETTSRFLLAMLMLAVVTSTLWTMRWPRLGRVYANALRAGSVLLLLLYAAVGWATLGALAAALLLTVAALGALGWHALRRYQATPRFVLRAVLALGLLVALTEARARLRYPLLRAEFALHPHPTFWVASAEQLDDPAHPRTIAMTGGPQQDEDRWFAYAFLGQRLQNRLLYVTPLADGTVGHFGHAEINRRFVRDVDAAAWLKRLRTAGVSHVVSFDPPSVELEIMQANPRFFRRVSSPGLKAFGVFELLRRGGR
jgi:hypothetical protein